MSSCELIQSALLSAAQLVSSSRCCRIVALLHINPSLSSCELIQSSLFPEALLTSSSKQFYLHTLPIVVFFPLIPYVASLDALLGSFSRSCRIVLLAFFQHPSSFILRDSYATHTHTHTFTHKLNISPNSIPDQRHLSALVLLHQPADPPGRSSNPSRICAVRKIPAAPRCQ